MVLKEFFPETVKSKCLTSRKMHLLLTVDINQGNVLNLFAKRKKNLMGFNITVASLIVKLVAELLNSLFFQVRSS